MEFKGTDKIVIDQGSVFKPTSGYVSVQLKNTEGWPVATVFAPTFEKLKADSLCLSKAPEMLEMLHLVADVLSDAGKDKYAKKVEALIKEATEI